MGFVTMGQRFCLGDAGNADYEGELARIGQVSITRKSMRLIMTRWPYLAPRRLDVLVLCQGTVRYGREEFEKQGWDAVMDVNINSVMHCANKFKPLLAASGGSLLLSAPCRACAPIWAIRPMPPPRRARSA